MGLLLPLLLTAATTVPTVAETAVAVSRHSSDAPLPEQGVLVTGAPGNRRLRGDWEPPDALMLTLRADWLEAQQVVVQAALPGLPLVLLSDGSALSEGMVELLPELPGRSVTLFDTLYDSPWVRDYGPLQVLEDERPIWLDFSYHADRWLDDQIPAVLARHLGVEVEQHRVALEGGAVISDGSGLCAITDASLADTGISPQEPEAVDWLLGRLGCLALAVVPALPAESTGHVDMLAQFLAADTVAVALVDALAFPNTAAALEQAATQLRAGALLLGRQLKVVRVPMLIADGLHYSYVNGTHVRGAFLVPSYRAVPTALETEAYYVLKQAIPHIDLIPVPSDELIAHGGAVHCITVGLLL